MILGAGEEIFGRYKHPEALNEESAGQVLRNLIREHDVFEAEVVAVMHEKVGRSPVARVGDYKARDTVGSALACPAVEHPCRKV